MAGKNRENTSETFGRYTDSSSASKKNQVNGPKNITSDMWSPISMGRTEQKPAQKSPRTKKSESAKQNLPENKKKTPPPISEGRGAKAPTAKAPSKSKKKKSRVPKGRPISEITATADDKRSKAKELRQHQQRSKADRHYDEGLRDGKSPSELSKERAAIKRKKRIRRNVISVSLFLVFVIAFLGIYIYSKGAPVAVINVEGESIYTEQEIIDASEVVTGVNMFALRQDNINTLVTSVLPYIHSVELKRQLPDSLTLSVTGTRDKYLIVNGESYICVDSYDKVVSTEVKKLEDGFFRIKGFTKQEGTVGTQFTPTEENEEKYELIKRIIAAIENEGVIKRGVINVGNMRNVRLYCNGIMVYMGTCFDVEKQISETSNIIKSQFAEGETGYINVKTKVPAFQKGTLKAD